MVFASHHADKGSSGMDANSYWQPRSLRVAMTRLYEQLLSCLDRAAWMFWPGKAWDKKSNRFISHQPVYKCIGLYQDMSRYRIKTVDQSAEFKCSHLFGEFGRTAHICKKHRQNHFRAAGM